MKKTVVMVCGTRPEIIKMAPVYRALQADGSWRIVLVHSGQHDTLAAPFYRQFAMDVTHTLALDRAGGSLADLSAGLLRAFSPVFQAERPAAVLVHGDTSTAAMAALAAFYEKIPVGHVEAGLRTQDLYSPFPEELNRSMIGRVAQWHYAPTQAAVHNLLREGIAEDAVLRTGNTVIDAAFWMRGKLLRAQASSPVRTWIEDQAQDKRRLVVVTAHRRENWGGGLEQIAKGVRDITENFPDVAVLWPLHANPAVQTTVRQALGNFSNHPRVLLTQPLEYDDMIWALASAYVLLTDSGGLQEEASAFNTPVLVLRDSTERPELIDAGGGILVGASAQRIASEVKRLHADPGAYAAMRQTGHPFGDGTAAARIVAHLKEVVFGGNVAARYASA